MHSIRYEDRTRMFARVLGPFLAIIAVVVAVRPEGMRPLLMEFTASHVWPWVVGAFVLLVGLVIVAFHQVWHGAAAIVVSALGWLIVARGIFLLAFPDTFASVADRVIGATGVWQAVYVVMAVVGLYLTYVGWRPARQEPGDVHISIDFPHAA